MADYREGLGAAQPASASPPPRRSCCTTRRATRTSGSSSSRTCDVGRHDLAADERAPLGARRLRPAPPRGGAAAAGGAERAAHPRRRLQRRPPRAARRALARLGAAQLRAARLPVAAAVARDRRLLPGARPLRDRRGADLGRRALGPPRADGGPHAGARAHDRLRARVREALRARRVTSQHGYDDHGSHHHAEQRRRDPAARVRRLPDRARRARRTRRSPRSRSATGTSTRPRCTATRRRSARRSASPGIDRGEIFVTSKLNNGFHDPEDAAPRLRAVPSTRSTSTTSTCSSCTGRCPSVGDYVETWKAMEKMYEGGKVRAIGVSNFKQHHLQPAARRDHRGAGGEPDRDPPVPDAGRPARLRRRARHRDRGLVADRAGQGARGPGARADREPASSGRPRR